jgi:hypothetical protein
VYAAVVRSRTSAAVQLRVFEVGCMGFVALAAMRG